MRYLGPIYRPPSEADSLLIQATIGCPHNRCTFCMVYKNGPRFWVRDVADIKEDLLAATEHYGKNVRTLFFPAGNTIATINPMIEMTTSNSISVNPLRCSAARLDSIR